MPSLAPEEGQNMNVKVLIAGAALATAGLAGIGAGTASAGCGITLELHNRSNAPVNVDWWDSDVRTGGLGIWKRLGGEVSHVEPGETVRRTFTADLGCRLARQYRLHVTEAESPWLESWFVYHGYTTDQSPHIHVD